jgi:hypothetical protein
MSAFARCWGQVDIKSASQGFLVYEYTTLAPGAGYGCRALGTETANPVRWHYPLRFLARRTNKLH